jgi:hypothetical protein
MRKSNTSDLQRVSSALFAESTNDVDASRADQLYEKVNFE